MYNQELPQDLSSSLDDRSKVMIDGLPLSCQETHLSAYLSRITDGKVKDIRFVFYKEKKLGVAFVTLLDRKSAKALVSAFERRKSLNTMGVLNTSMDHLMPEKWTVQWAPPANDVIEANLRFSRSPFSFRWILRNALFVVCVWFLSTPGHMLMHTKEWLSSLHLWIDDYMPTVLFSIFSILLPLLVTLLNALIPSFYTKSDEARDVMIKKYFLLVMVTVIMPTLGFLDSRQLFQFITHAEENMQFMKLKCFFMADSGAFFIKYLIFSATIGNVQFYFVTILTTSTLKFTNFGKKT